MKKNIIYLFLLLGFTIHGQEYKENIKKELHFSSQSADNLFILKNINGNIDVEGYDGQTIILELVKTIKAESEAEKKKGMEEIQFGLIEKGDVIVVYMKNPCSNIDANQSSDELRKGMNMDWKKNCKWETDYDFNLDYKVKVPKNIMVDISTINNGEVSLRNVSGALKAHNINGGITLDNIAGDVEANTINGDLNLTYIKNPTGKSTYHSLNGDINAFFQRGLSADMFFESFNGDFYTSLDNLQALPVELQKRVKKDKGVAYKVGGKSGVRVGQGTAHLDFQTFNGNVYVKEVTEE